MGYIIPMKTESIMNETTITDTVRFYFRHDVRLRWAGQTSLTRPPDGLEARRWAYAEQAGKRLERLRQATRKPARRFETDWAYL